MKTARVTTPLISVNSPHKEGRFVLENTLGRGQSLELEDHKDDSFNGVFGAANEGQP
jgi:hypothetical protein